MNERLNANHPSLDIVLELAIVRARFEACMQAYKDHEWEKLLPLMAPRPRKNISNVLKKHGGAQIIIDTGEVSKSWSYQCARLWSPSRFYLYALLETQKTRTIMRPFKFVFTSSRQHKQTHWVLMQAEPISYDEFARAQKDCAEWLSIK